jgi:hypothetical protein
VAEPRAGAAAERPDRAPLAPSRLCVATLDPATVGAEVRRALHEERAAAREAGPRPGDDPTPPAPSREATEAVTRARQIIEVATARGRFEEGDAAPFRASLAAVDGAQRVEILNLLARAINAQTLKIDDPALVFAAAAP